MSHEADVIVVGSGPSGISAVLPMLEAGMRVLLLDGGKERPADLVPPGAYHDIRRSDPEQWRVFLGPDLEALRREGPPSPKFDAPASRFAFEDLSREQRIEGRGFAAIGSLARGGMSNIWGAGISAWDEQDLAGFPLTLADLAPSYERVARRAGVTGFVEDDLRGPLDGRLPSLPPLDLSANARRVYDRYARNRGGVTALGVRIGRPRIAVLSREHGGRGACKLCDMCIWGCRENAIYSAAFDLAAIETHEALDYRPGSVVETIDRCAAGYRLAVRRGGVPSELRCARVVLAAGGLVTARLVLELEGRFGDPVPVVGVPGMGFALLLPERLGGAVATREFSMGQLSFAVEGDGPGDEAYGSLFPASGVPAWLTIERMPLTRPGAVKLFRLLQPALLLGNCFLPGRYSRDTARLERDAAGRAVLIVRGGTSPDLAPRLARIRRQLARAFLRLGVVAIPGSFSAIGPGEAIRYSGMFPMRARPGAGEVDPLGELHGAPGLHLADLAIFPAMPAKHHTLTLMANADRIGRGIAERWRG
jgi:choline dehydrogenase-like flavoprotein